MIRHITAIIQSNQPHRPTPLIPGFSWFPSLWAQTSCPGKNALLSSHASLQSLIPLVSINKSSRSLKHLSTVIPNFNTSSLVPFSCSGGYRTFFLLGLNCRSTDCLVKDSQFGSGLEMSLPLLFMFTVLLWPCGPSNFSLSCIYTLSSLHMPAPVFRVSTI